MAKKAKEGMTNYFQTAAIPLTAPKEVTAIQKKENNVNTATISWNTAYAGDAPIKTYEIWCDGSKIKEIPFTPQLTTDPFTWSEQLSDKIPIAHTYTIKVTDAKGRIAESVPVMLEKLG
jgi:hypothetical protein